MSKMSNKSDRIFVIVEALTRYVHSSKLSTLHNDCSVTLITLQVYVGGNLALMDGTSASAPLAAAMISLINARRLQAGLGSVGYINPTIYANQVNLFCFALFIYYLNLKYFHVYLFLVARQEQV